MIVHGDRPNRCTSREPFRASGQASELSPDHVLQHLSVQGQICHNFLQPAVLVFELLQLLHLGWKKPGVSFLPVKVGRRTDPGFATDLRDSRAVLALLDNERLLRVRKFARLHCDSAPLPAREM